MICIDDNGKKIIGPDGCYILANENDKGKTAYIRFDTFSTHKRYHSKIRVQADKDGNPIDVNGPDGYIKVVDDYQGNTAYVTQKEYANNQKICVKADRDKNPIKNSVGYIKVKKISSYKGYTTYVTKDEYTRSQQTWLASKKNNPAAQQTDHDTKKISVKKKGVLVCIDDDGKKIKGPDGYIIPNKDHKGKTASIKYSTFKTFRWKNKKIFVQADKDSHPVNGPVGYIKVENVNAYQGNTACVTQNEYANSQKVCVRADKDSNPVKGPTGCIRVKKDDDYQGNTTYITQREYINSRKVCVRADKDGNPVKGPAGCIRVKKDDDYQGNTTYITIREYDNNRLLLVRADKNNVAINGPAGFTKVEKDENYQDNTTCIKSSTFHSRKRVLVRADKKDDPIKGPDGFTKVKKEDDYQGNTTYISKPRYHYNNRPLSVRCPSNKKAKLTHTQTTSANDSTLFSLLPIKSEQDNNLTPWTTDDYIDTLRSDLISIFNNQDLSCFITTRFIIDYAKKMLRRESLPSLDENYTTLSEKTASVEITTDLVLVKNEKGQRNRKREPLHCLGLFSEKGLNSDIQSVTPHIDITQDNPVYSSVTTIEEGIFKKISCFKDDLSNQLLNHAKEQNIILIGHVGLMNAKDYMPGHVFTYIATQEKVYFIDADMVKDNQPEKIIFTQDELNQYYNFGKKESSNNDAIFRENCFYVSQGILSNDLFNDCKADYLQI